MPIYMEYDGIKGNVTAEGQAATAGATDPEFKYVAVRRVSATDEGDDSATTQADLTADDGSGTRSGFDAFLELEGVKGESKIGIGPVGDLIVDFNSLDAYATTVLNGGDEAYRTQFGNNNAPEAAPPGTGKTLSASLLGQRTPEDGGVTSDLVAEVDAAALSHGTTVLAWARVDGTSLASDGGRDLLLGGITVDDAAYDPAFRGGITVAVGDVETGDDVVVDGRIVTGGNPAAASTHELGHTLGFRHEHTRPDGDDAAAGDIVVGAGPGGGPHVKVLDGADGDVDGGDFLVWQRGGSAGANGGADLAQWQNNYGSGGAGDDLLIGGLTEFDDGAGDIVPTDQFSLNFGRVDIPAAADGGIGIVQVGLGDGSVRFLSDGIDPF
jgi:hypothetical protein